MKIKFVYTFVFLAISLCVNAQIFEYAIGAIPDSLKENANAVVRLHDKEIKIVSANEMITKETRIVTVFNKYGLELLNFYQYYDNNTSVKNIEAQVLNIFGKEIKKLKRKDFIDHSASGNGTIFSDSRVLYLDYIPLSYPCTIKYTSEVISSSTAHIPTWTPVSEYNLSIEKSVFKITTADDLGFDKKEYNLDNYRITKNTNTANTLVYTANNIKAPKYEPLISLYKISPKVKMHLTSFNLEGVNGTASNWKEFGTWYATSILKGTTELPEATKNAMKKLVENAKSPIEKAKIIYNYVQNKSRYVSIQVGIGGWKPMLAGDVDRLGYGDCKALSNYTKALLASVDVPSYNTLIYGDKDIINAEKEFLNLSFNHMILCVPDKENYVFLECTSQDDPFGFQANFTDDRDVLIIKPDGGEIVHTKVYTEKDNLQNSTGSYSISSEGDLKGNIQITTFGAQYGDRVRAVEKLQAAEREAHYKEYWNTILDLKLGSIEHKNNKETIAFSEKVEISALKYASNTNNKLLFAVNVFNPRNSKIPRVRNRKTPFEIMRGYTDVDEITITLPATHTIEFLPPNFEITTKFGNCSTQVIKNDNNTLTYKRTVLIKKGNYTAQEYEEFRNFIEKIERNDNAKIILTKI